LPPLFIGHVWDKLGGDPREGFLRTQFGNCLSCQCDRPEESSDVGWIRFAADKDVERYPRKNKRWEFVNPPLVLLQVFTNFRNEQRWADNPGNHVRKEFDRLLRFSKRFELRACDGTALAEILEKLFKDGMVWICKPDF